MTIPTYSSLMLPLLQVAGDGKVHSIRDSIDTLASYVGLNEDERTELMPNGKQLKFNYRVHCANSMLKRAGLLESRERGTFRITELGVKVLQSSPLAIDHQFLMQFPQYVDYVSRSQTERRLTVPAPRDLIAGDSAHDAEMGTEIEEYYASEQTPRELMYIIYQGLRKELQDDLLESVMNASPAFFEKLVVDLLLAMGYGGSLKNAGRILGRTGDGGVDGVIKEDKLGLDLIYVQAKRYAPQNTVGRPAIQAFVGSLTGRGATKGVFITTSRFTKEALEYAERMQQHNIILIDGASLAQLMVEHEVGVSIEETYIVKTVNRDYFDIE